MERTTVESTTMLSVGYEPRTGVLEIEFQSGAVYQYFEVPERVQAALMQAESKGEYFNFEIRDIYHYVVIGPAPHSKRAGR